MTHSLTLTRPLAFFDLETTGTSVATDRIVEIAILKLLPGGKSRELLHLVNPGMPIPPGATAVHGIADMHVALAPTFRELAPRIREFLEGCDISGYNVRRFDLPLLKKEFERAGMTIDLSTVHVVDVMTIFHSREPRDLSAAMRFYCGREIGGTHGRAHGAMADVLATAEIFEAQLERYADLPRDIADLEKTVHPKDASSIDEDGKIVWSNGEAVINFGKHGGRTLRELAVKEREYFTWILGGNFSDSVKNVIRDALEGRFPEKNTGS